MSAKRIDHKVNHVSLVVDKSGSMRQHETQLVRVVDEFVKGLQEESDRLGHETRISLYAFDHEVHNLVWDMDVKHLPSLQGLYKVDNGATALIEAAVKSIDDLKNIWEGYGEHSFLQVLVTDGEENASGCSRTGKMHIRMGAGQGAAVLRTWMDRIRSAMDDLPDHWTSAILVPNSLAKRTAQEYGFPAGNIAIWDADSSKGVEEAIGTVKTAATSFLRGREKGVRGTRNLFAMGQDLSTADVKANLDALDAGKYILIPVDQQTPIRDFVTSAGHPYKTGCAFYELSKREKIQGSKQLAVAEKDPATGRTTGRVFSGPAARRLLGLPTSEATVKPGDNPSYTVFVQSTSVNRKLVPGTKLLVLL
ncbi:VWA domain-containing protein [Kitasatospora sp. NBC_01287]|uniref:vWA domain-containing protein n=1 Tax=Kitasatospora sp. NBC_01287 TaxID=2903573 RepID=UPI002251AEA0|nr:vWA domain-containing protein [Kitasatospora sp. NBC_01287]MCX4751061.1 VWA domain-containing protein [Kitasatospora sp. NBC_01287]